MSGGVLGVVLADLGDETAELDTRVAGLAAAEWQTPTPAVGWTVAHQIAHLAWTDQAALLAIAQPDEFARQIAELWSAESSPVDAAADEGARRPPDELLDAWRAGRRALREALIAVPAGERIRWFGPPMSPASMATARFMETWAHGLDVAEALGDRPEPTDRIRHVCHLGVRTRDFSYAQRGLSPPAEPFRVELTGPSGDRWTWGPVDATQWVSGAGYDFALLATRRRHRDDVDVRAKGADAERWLDIIQAFAGPPGADPERRS
ncbi:MAG: TIGR03084 family metal-binding protein [Nocardioidaceae bacterium]